MHWDHEPDRPPARPRNQAIGSRTSTRTTTRTKGWFMESLLSFLRMYRTMNPPLTPPRRGTDRTGTNACSPPLEGSGVGSCAGRARTLALRFGFSYSPFTMRIGSLELKSNLFLSPLAGYTNLPFRLALREVGGLDLATTDLVNARSLLEKNHKALKLIETCPADRPLAVQLFGSVPEEMRDATVYLEGIGVQSVDIN